MAAVVGFEPTNAGVKVLYITAWRHRSIYLMVQAAEADITSTNQDPLTFQLNV